MRASDIRACLQKRATELKALGVKSLSLFGSAAQARAKENSDLDFLVEFEGPATFEGYMTLKELLEAEFGRKIDLVTVRALKSQLRDKVIAEAVKVA
jgi:predicted nucleotidyltransferase